MNKYHIYTFFNSINGKIYVGKAKNPNKRFIKHLRIASSSRSEEKFYIHKAIKKYGKENFIFTILQIFDIESDCNLAEKFWIKNFKSNIKEFGYNLTEGGEGCVGRTASDETREKIRKKALGRRHDQKTIELMSGENNHGAKLSLNDIKNIRLNYSKFTFIELSALYKVSPRNIAGIVYNKYWVDKNYIPPAPRNNYKNRNKNG